MYSVRETKIDEPIRRADLRLRYMKPQNHFSKSNNSATNIYIYISVKDTAQQKI